MPRDRTDRLLRTWQRLSGLPGGKVLFSALLGRMAPYSGSVRPRVEALAPGVARVRMHDRRRVRNHLRSIHAIALMNLAEMTTGLAMLAGMPKDARAILIGLEIEYKKKARGTITGEARVDVPRSNERQELTLEAVLRDEAGDEVARARARWLIGPRPDQLPAPKSQVPDPRS
jgi:acyl-coenzyme A thioesterase PaaI-like protein